MTWVYSIVRNQSYVPTEVMGNKVHWPGRGAPFIGSRWPQNWEDEVYFIGSYQVQGDGHARIGIS